MNPNVIDLSSLVLSTFRQFSSSFGSKKFFLINWSRPISLKSWFKVSGTVDVCKMARIIKKGCSKDVLEIVRWQECVAIYFHCFVFCFLIVCKSFLCFVKNYFDIHFGSARRHIVHKFPALSLIRRGGAHNPKNQRSIECPHQLTDSQLGNHKYIKLKVRSLGGIHGPT